MKASRRECSADPQQEEEEEGKTSRAWANRRLKQTSDCSASRWERRRTRRRTEGTELMVVCSCKTWRKRWKKSSSRWMIEVNVDVNVGVGAYEKVVNGDVGIDVLVHVYFVILMFMSMCMLLWIIVVVRLVLQREVYRTKRRERDNLPIIAIVGYTNAGKPEQQREA